ncbi:DUF620 family protein (DUF620) [Rhynchospora pubera]|uniref:DUF620 family protein (DUF620) n=1 Tax=Rhynchospora pubera TaxID=906938 RepID=A0AAV8D1W8_9POAL|nr:DUF620 family protein (DUF620) [Rhynchospora pubera]
MRKLCPNLEREDGLETVLEVPIPEEMFASLAAGGGGARKLFGGYSNVVKSWMLRPHHSHHGDQPRSEPASMSRSELQLMLGVIGAPLIPLSVPTSQSPLSRHLRDDHFEATTAKYIVQQYIAASGGEWALNAVTSMYAMGKVKMSASELNSSDVSTNTNAANGTSTTGNNGSGKKGSSKGMHGSEIGGFVLWQKQPDMWCLELVVSGCKISAGSDGRVAWRQTPWHQSHASRGPPRPLRRSLQGLDPMLTANLFANSVCKGEKSINGEDCFVLKVEAEAASLQARNSSSVEIMRHTVWGYFSQRTGLLVQLEDSHLLRIKSASQGSVYWETTMESVIEDYRPVDGINIAHSGRTAVSLLRYGDTTEGNTRTRMEEVWTIEEVDFNIWGLSKDCFLPPSDLRDAKQDTNDHAVVLNTSKNNTSTNNNVHPPSSQTLPRVQSTVRVGPSQVAAIDDSDSSDENQTT